MGITSDLKKVKKLFPEARRAVGYSPVKLQEASLDEIKKDMKRIYDELSPCDIELADIEATISDERIKEVLKICKNLELNTK